MTKYIFFSGKGGVGKTVLAQTEASAIRSNNTFDKLTACVTLEGVRAHQAALQTIADANGGTRAAGTPGYDASVEYVADQLNAAGYDVTLKAFPFTYFPLSLLNQTAPITATYESGVFTGSGYGDVTANVTAVYINLAPPRASTSGCEAADFAGFPAGHIALIQRGTCAFAVKALNAQAAGASAVIIFNPAAPAAPSAARSSRRRAPARASGRRPRPRCARRNR